MRLRGKRLRKPGLLAEDLVHDLGTAGESGHDLMAVHELSRSRLVVRRSSAVNSSCPAQPVPRMRSRQYGLASSRARATDCG